MKVRWLLLSLVVVALLVPALMITAARVLEPDGGRWVRLVSFTPFAGVLYAAVILVLALPLVVARGLWRRGSGVLAVLVVPLLAVHLWWASGPYVGQAAAADGRGQSFTVMASNLSIGEADSARVVEVALANDADVLVLTEITPTALEEMQRAGLAKAFPHSGGEALGGVDGTMVFSRHRLGDTRRLDTTSTGLDMTVAVAGQDVRLLAVHPYPPTGDARIWRADHAAVRRAAAAATGPTVIAGDFNATLDHRPMRELHGRGFSDAAEQATSGWQPTWPAAGEMSLLGVPAPPVLAIDHVLVTGELVATHTESVTIPNTDHRAVIAKLAVR
jgi:endonuclease/exonuclease/phosphatase (EEP) superfamily protein YafD